MASKTHVPTLALDYDPDLGADVLGALERAGRATGLPLAQIELLGQDPHAAAGFTDAVEAGDITGFIAAVDWDGLDARLQQRCVTAVPVPRTR